MKHRTMILFAALATFACGSGYHGPIDPSPTPTNATLSFTPETSNPTARSFNLLLGVESIPNQITVLIRANDFTSGFSMFRGTLVFDSTVLTVVNFSDGEFMKQDGALATFSMTGLGTNQATIRIDRPSSLSGATGTGTIVALRFKPASATAHGTTALQWDDPHAYTSSFSDVLQRTYGGTITVTR